MTKPFKFRYVNELVGAFVLLTIVLMIGLIVFVGQAQKWFEARHEIYIQFPTKGTDGLKEGAEVEIMETAAGRLAEILILPDGSMEGRITINGNFIGFVRQDSEAIIKKRFAVAGDSYIEITRGTDKPLEGIKPYIMCRKDNDVTEMIQEIVVTVQEAVIPLLDQVKATLAAYQSVAVEMTTPESYLQQTLASIQRLVAGVEDGQGLAGLLLRDEAAAREVQEMLQSLNTLSAQLVAVGDQVQGIAADVKNTTGNQLPELTRETGETIDETRRLIEGVQQHWLLRGSMQQDAPPERLPPSGRLP